MLTELINYPRSCDFSIDVVISSGPGAVSLHSDCCRSLKANEALRYWLSWSPVKGCMFVLQHTLIFHMEAVGSGAACILGAQ